jgi:hypothetical protein
MRNKNNNLRSTSVAMYVVATVTVVTMLFSLFVITPIAFAGSITVTNDNTASIANVVMVAATTGNNMSTGDSGGNGGNGGNTGTVHNGSTTGGDGGNGGNGGNGGTIQTGEAIATALLTTELNTTSVEIEDTRSDENKYNEYLRESIRTGSQSSFWEKKTENYDEESTRSYGEESVVLDEYSHDESSEVNGGNETESSDSSMWGNEQNSYAQSSNSTNSLNSSRTTSTSDESAEWNNYDLEYSRTYVPTDDDITVDTTSDAVVMSMVGVMADTGNNFSHADRGGQGGEGGHTGTTHDSSSRGGIAGDGATGGAGGNITTGRSDALADIVTISGRTTTRIVR